MRGFARRIEELRQGALAAADFYSLDLDASKVAPVDVTEHLVYYTVPPARELGDRRLTRFLEAAWGRPKRLIYLSTTGVYGDHGGGLVSEDTLPVPRTERATRRLAAENSLREWAEARALSWCILRVPGIYGPGRLPLERLLQGEPAIAPSEGTPGNRIHVTDLVTACVAAGRDAQADKRIYNVTDGSEDSHTAFLQRVATIARLPAPPLISRSDAQRSFSAMSWSFHAESRRVDNRRMLAELGVVLKYGDLDAGVRASLMEETSDRAVSYGEI